MPEEKQERKRCKTTRKLWNGDRRGAKAIKATKRVDTRDMRLAGTYVVSVIHCNWERTMRNFVDEAKSRCGREQQSC